MKELKKVILCITVVFLFNCKDKAQENNIQEERNLIDVNFDNVLKCTDYSYDENYFVTADYGCIYKQHGNDYGNVIIYLLPKKKSGITDEQIENENKRINKLSVDEYKKEFKILAFLIDNKYLNQNKSDDPEYYQKSTYEEKAYSYDEKQNKWVFIDSKKINSEEENQNEKIWRKNIIVDHFSNEHISKSCEFNNNVNEYKFTLEGGEYSNEKEQKHPISAWIIITNKKNKKTQEIYFEPNSWSVYRDLPCEDFIIEDYNFDGLEDFAIVWDNGGGSGKLYEYYFQDKNGNFSPTESFPLQHGMLAENIDLAQKTIRTQSAVGCCHINLNKYKLNSNGNWEISSDQQELRQK